MGTGWLLFDLMDEDDMEDAKKRLNEAQRNGIYRESWHFCNTNSADYPICERSRLEKLLRKKTEYKSQTESSQDYISRLIDDGKKIKTRQFLHLIKNNLSLDFRIIDEKSEEKLEERTFYDVHGDSTFGGIMVDLKDVKGIIRVNTNIIRLDYQGWSMTEKKGYFASKPDEILFIS